MDPVLHHLRTAAQSALRPRFTERVLDEVRANAASPERPLRIWCAVAATLSLAGFAFCLAVKPQGAIDFTPGSPWAALAEASAQLKHYL